MEHIEGRAVSIHQHAAAADAAAQERLFEVFHEGSQVRIRLHQARGDRVLMIPLRNGFPLYALDRAAQCFTVIDGQGRRVANAIRFQEFGLRLVFDHPPKASDYFIRTETPVGRA